MMAQWKVEAENVQAQRLPPRIHPRIQHLLQDKELLFSLVERYSSPLNLVFPQNIQGNIDDFQRTYRKHRLRGKVYFTSKPCKSSSLIRAASGAGIGIDVSSARSLQKVMACGWKAQDISATGPKSRDYIKLAIQHDALINIDNIDELKQIVAIGREIAAAHKTKVTLRLADCGKDSVKFLNQEDTTFGIRSEDIGTALSLLEQHKDRIELNGFSYHSSMASDEQRIAAMTHQIELTFHAIKKGFKISSINIGGGFPIMYADSCQQWADYTHSLKEAVLGKTKSQIWNGGGMGYRNEGGILKGAPAFINHAPVHTKSEELDRWLSFRLPSLGNVMFSEIVRDSLLNLSIEPGRGMLDQCAITLGRVCFTKRSAKGAFLAGLEMNRSNLHSDNFKVMTDPVLISRNETRMNTEQEGIFYTGNLCLSHDMIQYNKTYPPFLPEAGDIAAFINTAAYRMDFSESETLMQPLARKIAMSEDDFIWSAHPEEQTGVSL